MVIDFRGILDRVTLKKAIALMSKPPFWLTALRFAFALLIVASIAGLVYSSIIGEVLSASRVIRTLFQDVFLGYFVVQPYFASKTMFKRLDGGDREITGRVTPMGIYYNAGKADQVIEYPWDGFHKVFKTSDLVVLATADSRISILPQYFFGDAQDWKHFCQYVDSRVKPEI